MELKFNNSINTSQPWGIVPFDEVYEGLPVRTFNLLRTCNREAAISAVGPFLKAGIDLGQRVAIVSFEHPSIVMAKLSELGFSFDSALVSEQVIYLYYKPVFSYSISFSENYWQLYEEAKRLSNKDVGRIVFFNAEVLFNLETHLLAEASAERIMASFNDNDCVILGCYQQANTESHKYLDEVGGTILGSYMDIQKMAKSNDRRYELTVRRSPFIDEDEISSLELCLSYGSGFDYPNVQLKKHG